MLTRTLLLLLNALFVSRAAEDKIDLNKCGLTMTCFVRKSCIDGATADKLSLYPDENKAPLTKGDCDVVIQMRNYMRNRYRVIMQVNASDSTQTMADSDISLKQDAVQFACTKQAGPTVNAAFFTLSDSHYKWEEKNVICAFTITAKDAYKSMFMPFVENYFKPQLEFTLGSPQTINYEKVFVDFWMSKASYDCNPESITSSILLDDVLFKDEIDKYASSPISCENSKFLIVTRKAEKPLILGLKEQLICTSIAQWQYKNRGVETNIAENETINVVCAEKYCSRCAPLELLTPAEYSEPINETTNDKCLVVKCPKDQWMIDGDRVVMGKIITCEKDKEDQTNRNSAWYMNIEDSSERMKVTKAACFDQSVCWTAARLEEKCDKVDTTIMECTSFNRTSDDTKIYCADGFTLMHSYGGVIPTETTQLTCNFQTGNFNDGNSTEIRSGSTVYCGRQKERVVEQQAAEAGFDPMIGAVVGGLILLIIIAVIVVVVIRRRRVAAEKQTNNGEASGQPTQSTPDAAAGDPAKARGPWLARDRALAPIPDSKKEQDAKLTPEELEPIQLQQFVQYDVEMRMKVFAEHFANTTPHHFEMFWRYFRMFEERNMDCMIIWDSIGVHINVLYRQWTDLLRNRLLRFALPILHELYWTIRPGEHPTDTWMRFFIMRILLWAEEPTICKELRRQATLPIDSLESPMRAVVFQYVVRHVDDGETLMHKYWKMYVIDDPVDPKGDQFGTMRQHILYALATNDKTGQTLNKDTNRMVDDYDFTRKVLTLVGKSETYFSPSDWYWAYRGATEYHSSWKTAVELFAETSPYDYSEVHDRQLNEKCKNMTPEAKAVMKKEWMESSAAMASLMFESCSSQEQMHRIWRQVGHILDYCAPMNPDKTSIIPVKGLRERAANYAKLFIDVPKQDVFRDFEKYLRASNPPQ